MEKAAATTDVTQQATVSPVQAVSEVSGLGRSVLKIQEKKTNSSRNVQCRLCKPVPPQLHLLSPTSSAVANSNISNYLQRQAVHMFAPGRPEVREDQRSQFLTLSHVEGFDSITKIQLE